MTTDVQNDAYNRIESYEVSPIRYIPEETPNNASRRSAGLGASPIKYSAGKTSFSKLSQIAKAHLDIKTSLIFKEKVEAITAICTWRTEKVGIWYDSYKFYEYDLQSGKLERKLVLTRNGRSKVVAKGIKYVDKDHIIIHFIKHSNPKPYAVVYNLTTEKIVIDSKEFEAKYMLKSIAQVIVLKAGRLLMLYKKFGSQHSVIGEVDIQTITLKDIMNLDISQTPDDIWPIDDKILAGRSINNSDTLFIWDLEKKVLRHQKKLPKTTETADDEALFPNFWSVTRIDEQTIAFGTNDIVCPDMAIVIYNWVEDYCVATFKVDNEDIIGIVNDELFVVLGDRDSDEFETRYAKISIKDVLKRSRQEKVRELEFQAFGNYFMGFDKDYFVGFDNQRNVALLMQRIFPQNLFIMRKRNRKIEMLRF